MKDHSELEPVRLADLLTPGRTLELKGTTRSRVFAELAACIAADGSELDERMIVAALNAREQVLSTRVSETVAVPHAVLPAARTWLAVGRSRSGVTWERGDPKPVRLVALIVGPRRGHLAAIARVAERLGRPGVLRALLDAPTPREVYAHLTETAKAPERPDPGHDRINRTCFRQADRLARDIGADRLVLHADAVASLDFLPIDRDGPPLLLVAEDPTRYPHAAARADAALPLPFRGHDRGGQIDVALLYAVSQHILNPTDRVVSVCGVPASGVLDMVRISDLAAEYRHLLATGDEILPRDLDRQVLLRTLQLAARIAEEGREGDAVGTLFIVGDYGRVRRHCRQMIINPFRGCSDDSRNILDPALEETLKEFARLDGAFIVRGDGRIVSAGTYLRTEAPVDDLPPGLGARHAAAAAITKATRAFSVVVSQSTRRVSLFKRGRRVFSFQP